MSTFIFQPVQQKLPSAAVAQASAVATAPSIISIEERRSQLQQQMRKKIDSLPQRDQLQESDIAQWVGFVANTMPDQAMWHVIRAGGIGGSEIGGLVRNFMGYRADFMFSAHDWALEKLFRRFPQAQNSDMRRGIENESLHRERFYREFLCHRDEGAFKALSEGKGTLPWMRYSPDDIVVFDADITIEMNGNVVQVSKGQRLLIDYKSPSHVNAQDSVSFQYACQLNMGAILANELEVRLDGSLLSQYDWANWLLKNDFVHIDPKLAELIKEAGNTYWSDVLNGRVPAYIQSQTADIEPEQIEKTMPLARKIAQLNAIATAAKNESEQLRKRLLEEIDLKDRRLAGQKIAFPNTLNIGASMGIDQEKVLKDLAECPEILAQCVADGKKDKVSYNVEAMVKTFEQMQIDTSQFVLPQLDPQKTYQALIEANKDPESYVTETLRFTVNKKVSEGAKAWVAKHFSLASEDVAQQADQNESNQTEQTTQKTRQVAI